MSTKSEQREPLLSDAQTTDMLMMEHYRLGGMNNLEATRFVRKFYEAKITSGELIPKSEVEEMLSVALGVSKSSVWAELGARTGFGTRVK